jgi:hypothetical protein
MTSSTKRAELLLLAVPVCLVVLLAWVISGLLYDHYRSPYVTIEQWDSLDAETILDPVPRYRVYTTVHVHNIPNVNTLTGAAYFYDRVPCDQVSATRRNHMERANAIKSRLETAMQIIKPCLP